MIPKIIHYTWFSNDPFPEIVMECMATWHEFMPEYEFKLWGMEDIKDIDSVFLKEALAERKWAFAADFVRLYAVYNYGGIYIDTDAKVYRSFDVLLKERAFIGRESSVHIEGGRTDVYLTSHCFGAEKNHPFIGRCLQYYNNRHFKLSEDMTLPMTLKFDCKLLPYIQAEIANEFGYNRSLLVEGIQKCEHGLIVLPKYYLDVENGNKPQVNFCKHYALGGWRDRKQTEDKNRVSFIIKSKFSSLVDLLLDKFGYMIYKKR